MRQRYVATIATVVLVNTIIFLCRHHIRDLEEIVGTYSGFYPYLQSHPDTLYRWQPSEQPRSSIPEDPSQEQQQHQVPKILHQIFLQEGRNSTLHKYHDALSSCRTLLPEWQHHLWTDENSTAFIREHYPDLAPHYEGYKQSIQRANILRYALLHHYGGVYLDLDVTCLSPLDSILDLPWLTPGAYPAGVNNAFILSRPRHRFLETMLASVAAHDLKWGMPYVENMLSTGCMFFSNRWMQYVSEQAKNPAEAAVAAEDRLFVLADQDGNLDPHMLRGKTTTPLFEHGGASSWHGWDAEAIVLIGKHYNYALFLFVAIVLMGVVGIWRLARSRSAGQMNRSFSWAVRRSLEKRQDVERGVGSDHDE